ncbi:MAG: hypothetical protein O7A62_14275 [Alphaproteobacteria bacterium]|nr:hypothetical protein [Alphaproteobacteria bacterium]
MNKPAIVIASAAILAASAWAGHTQDTSMSFFITSQGPGDGANLGGLAGADRQCRILAEAAGVTGKTWRAYLSTSTVNARDRIGNGPWFNAKGIMIADTLDALHGDGNKISKQTGLNEKGEQVNGRGDQPNRHDILTGSDPNGIAVSARTCGDWTNNGDGSAFVGHHDRRGLRDDAPSKSWNSSHPSRGCSQRALRSSGGDGLLYCFVRN